jgi:hypothetical protein
MTIGALLRRLRDEFTAMPGLRLNEKQVQRLCSVSASSSARALRALVSAGFLRALEDGSFRRADVPFDVEPRSASGAPEPPCRHILCVVELAVGLDAGVIVIGREGGQRAACPT